MRTLASSLNPPFAGAPRRLARASLSIEDWSRLVSFEPPLHFAPGDLASLRGLLDSILQGELQGNHIRTPGGLHSCAKILVSDAIVDTRALPKEIQFSNNDQTVTVSANWKFRDFLQELGNRNKSITATGGTDDQTLAGLLATNTAPASSKHAIFEKLEQVTYFTYDPGTDSIEEKTVARGQPEFASVVCSLGALGPITRLQFSLIDQPFFETVQKIVPLDEVLGPGKLEATSKEYDFWRIDWLPRMEKGLLWTAKEVPGTPSNQNGDYLPDDAVNVLELIFKLGEVFSGGETGPLLVWFQRMAYRLMARLHVPTTATGPLRNMLPVDRRTPLRVAMAEWCFHPDDLPLVRRECRKYFNRRGWPNLPIEIELTRTDDYHMSPWNWPELTGTGNKNYVVKFNFMYLTDICEKPDEKALISIHLCGLWEHLIKAGIRFKAHWGKLNFMNHDFVNTHYPGYGQFKTLTHDMFKNAYLRDRLP